MTTGAAAEVVPPVSGLALMLVVAAAPTRSRRLPWPLFLLVLQRPSVSPRSLVVGRVRRLSASLPLLLAPLLSIQRLTIKEESEA
jgi:hypothetical protein